MHRLLWKWLALERQHVLRPSDRLGRPIPGRVTGLMNGMEAAGAALKSAGASILHWRSTRMLVFCCRS
jgi:hypothetical protein